MAVEQPGRGRHASEHRRDPPPLLRRRIASRRAAMEQPNVTGDGDIPLTARFWAVLIATGIGAGVFGALLMALLHVVSELAFGPGATENFQAAVERASPAGRLTPLLIGGVVAGVGWFLLRRYVRGTTDVDDSIWTGDGRLSFRRSAGTSVLSEIVIALGASLGREAAPKLMGGVCGSLLATWTGLSVPQRRLVVACGAGAGLACVYNVPLAGALFTAEVLVGALRLPVVLPALACSATATFVAWSYLPSEPTYTGLPPHALTVDVVAWAVLAGPVIGLGAVGFVRAIGWVSAHQPQRWWWQITAPICAFALLGVVGLGLPELFGNGQDMAEEAFVVGTGGLGLFAALALLKPLMTVLCLGSGASGGLFTPTLSHRGGAGRRARHGLVAALAGHAGRYVRADRGRRADRRRDAGPAGGSGDGAGADPLRVRADGPGGAGDGPGHGRRSLDRRLLDLHGAPGHPAGARA